MKVILIMVTSIDGKTTRWVDGDTFKWTAKEDRIYFKSMVGQSSLIVIGRTTFDLARPKPKEGKLRIVLTSEPQKYKMLTVPGQLEFTNEDPKSLVIRLEKQGYKKLLLVGGGGVNTTFFQASLVDELWLTIEPRIFGKGKMIVDQIPMDISLKLDKMKRLNDQGTILLRYFVVKKP